MRARTACVAGLGAGVLALASACQPTPIGEILIDVQADMSLPKDIDTIRIEILNEGVPKFKNDYERLGTPDQAILLPGTLSLLASDNPSDAVQIIVSARRGGRDGTLRIVREAVTTIPPDRTVTLQLPLQFLCDGQAQIDPSGTVGSTCPLGYTCLAGTCEPNAVDSFSLPDYLAADIFTPGLCLDVGVCFNLATVATVEMTDCTLPAVPDQNIALQAEGDGICGTVGCFVALDAESALGWSTGSDGRVHLPPAVCTQMQDGTIANVVVAPASSDCPRKTTAVPTCGPWSAAGAAPPILDPIVLAGAQAHPTSLVLANGSLFWTNSGSFAGDGTIKSVGFLGGTPALEAENLQPPRDIASDGSSVFWSIADSSGASGGAIVKRLANGTSNTLIGGLDKPEGVAVRGDHVFWTEFGPNGGIFRASATNGTGMTLVANGNYPFRVAADDRFVYWTNEGTLDSQPPDGQVARYDTTGALGVELVADVQQTPRGLTLEFDDQSVPIALYWTTFGSSGALRRVILTNATTLGAVETLVDGLDLPSDVVIDGAYIYWSNRGDGRVMRLPRGAPAGTSADVVAEGQRAPASLSADETSLYWINEGSSDVPDGALMRVAKPQ